MQTLSLLHVRAVPDPILRQKAKRVRTVDGSVRRLVENMVETMYSAGGVGLAANQVGVLQRVVVIQLPEEDEPRVFINPEVVRRDGNREVEEGCLSIPGYRGLVNRSVTVRVKGLDFNGKQIRVKADELLAQALEHEVDHLDGILYIDRLKDSDSLWKLSDDRDESLAVEAGYSG